jgi:tRNA(His) guanylyltransferase
MKNDGLGDRVKKYEEVTRYRLTPRSPVFLRVDGRAFHTWTKRQQCTKPYDLVLIEAMIAATKFTAHTMSGFKLAYTQSDEATFMITDYDRLETQGWFDYNLSKLISITASAFTLSFNANFFASFGGQYDEYDGATFDCRAFTVPEDDAANVFLWRQKDWVRNSVQMLAQSHFSHKQLHGKNQADMHDMLYEKGVNWADLDPVVKNGAYITDEFSHRTDIIPTYPVIQGLIDEVMGL